MKKIFLHFLFFFSLGFLIKLVELVPSAETRASKKTRLNESAKTALPREYRLQHCLMIIGDKISALTFWCSCFSVLGLRPKLVQSNIFFIF